MMLDVTTDIMFVSTLHTELRVTMALKFLSVLDNCLTVLPAEC